MQEVKLTQGHERQETTRSWNSPMFDRKEGKKDALLCLDDRAERLNRFYSLIRSSGEKIHYRKLQNKSQHEPTP